MPALILQPHSPAWPAQRPSGAGGTAGRVRGNAGAVERIGSTAVPELTAKPVIDILVGADSLAAIEARIPASAAGGYTYVSRCEHELPMRRYFDKAAHHLPRLHVHAVVRDSHV